MEKKNDFETVMTKLNKIVEKLEDPSIKLEKSIELYEEGMILIKTAEKYLKEAERKIKIITEKDEIEDFE